VVIPRDVRRSAHLSYSPRNVFRGSLPTRRYLRHPIVCSRRPVQTGETEKCVYCSCWRTPVRRVLLRTAANTNLKCPARGRQRCSSNFHVPSPPLSLLTTRRGLLYRLSPLVHHLSNDRNNLIDIWLLKFFDGKDEHVAQALVIWWPS